MKVTLEQYLARRQAERPFQPRAECPRCLRAQLVCYCAHLKPITPATEFIILIHPNEVWRSIASGRMAHLGLSNSRLYEGKDFTEHEAVNRLIADPARYCVVLTPGERAINLTDHAPETRAALFPPSRQLTVFLIDGTWNQANKIKKLSHNLEPLPQVCFTPRAPSQFLVRKQPRAHCYSTIEAIHEFIDLVETPPAREHDNLLRVFQAMVNQQIDFEVKHGRRATRGERLATHLADFVRG